MLDYDKQRDLIKLFTLGVILVVIFTVIALVLIWKPEKEKEKVFEVGKVDSVILGEGAILNNYYEQISKWLMEEDLDSIVSLVAEDYLEYNKQTRQDVKEYLSGKGIIGKNLELIESRTYSVPGYSSVYYLDIKAVNEIYSLTVVIREVSPNNYTIAFDKFIDYSRNLYNETVNSIQMEIYERVRYTNSVEYTFRLKNNYDRSVTINSNNQANSVLLVSTSSTAKSPALNTMAAIQVKLETGQFRPFTVVYNMKDEFDYLTYNTLVLKDVLYDGMQGTTNIEYVLPI